MDLGLVCQIERMEAEASFQPGQALQPTAVVGDVHLLVAAIDQPADHLRTDEPCSTRDEHCHLHPPTTAETPGQAW
jgi:hypothetical protein